MRKIATTVAAYMLTVILAVLAFVIFLVLKLGGIIEWSWWAVTSPLWTLVMIVLLSFAFVTIAVMLLSMPAKKKANGTK